MTEAEWLGCENLQVMVTSLAEEITRKLTLFNAACCRRAWHPMADDRHREAIEAAESVADGVLTEQEFEDRLTPVIELSAELPPGTRDPWHPGHYLTGAARHLRVAGSWAASYAARAVAYASAPEQGAASYQDELMAQIRLLRDIFGNPFRPVAFSPEWRTDTVVTLARQMYEAREFGAMPILADALQDAGCDNDNVLSHCRDANATHVRGCWVVDLVLGKQ